MPSDWLQLARYWGGDSGDLERARRVGSRSPAAGLCLYHITRAWRVSSLGRRASFNGVDSLSRPAPIGSPAEGGRMFRFKMHYEDGSVPT